MANDVGFALEVCGHRRIASTSEDGRVAYLRVNSLLMRERADLLSAMLQCGWRYVLATGDAWMFAKAGL
jgi:hypothetical protein